LGRMSVGIHFRKAYNAVRGKYSTSFSFKLVSVRPIEICLTGICMV